MILVRITVDHPVLRETLSHFPNARVVWERTNAFGSDQISILVWIEANDFDAVDEALADDPTVTGTERLETSDGRRLYRMNLVESGLEASLYPTLIEVGGVVRDATATADGWEFLIDFPNRRAVSRFVEHCEETGMGFDVHRIVTSSDGEYLPRYDLTDRQYEALVAAMDLGYLSIPRGATLDDLAEELSISNNAASERFRRAVRTLVQHALSSDETEPTETDSAGR